MNIKAEKIAVLDQLESETHAFWTVDESLRMSRAFGFDVIVRVAKANPNDPKGLTLANGAAEAQGAGSREIAEAICAHLKLSYPGMMGRGFAVRACCHVIRQHLEQDVGVEWTKPKHEGAGDPVRIVNLKRGDEVGDIRIQHYGQTVRVAAFLPGITECSPGDTPKTWPERHSSYAVPSNKSDADAMFDLYVETAKKEGWIAG